MRQSHNTLIFEIRDIRQARVLKFNASTGYWQEFGEKVRQLSKKDVEFLSMAAPWTVWRYLPRG